LHVEFSAALKKRAVAGRWGGWRRWQHQDNISQRVAEILAEREAAHQGHVEFGNALKAGQEPAAGGRQTAQSAHQKKTRHST
jgi:hypothetical protein